MGCNIGHQEKDFLLFDMITTESLYGEASYSEITEGLNLYVAFDEFQEAFSESTFVLVKI